VFILEFSGHYRVKFQIACRFGSRPHSSDRLNGSPVKVVQILPDFDADATGQDTVKMLDRFAFMGHQHTRYCASLPPKFGLGSPKMIGEN
jgi:hypothetical protein